MEINAILLCTQSSCEPDLCWGLLITNFKLIWWGPNRKPSPNKVLSGISGIH